MSDDATTLLRRTEALTDRLDAVTVNQTVPGESMVVKTVTVTTYPTSAQRVYGVQAYDVTATESENQTPSYANATSTFYAVNVGAAVPASGTYVVVHKIDGLWVFRY